MKVGKQRTNRYSRKEILLIVIVIAGQPLQNGVRDFLSEYLKACYGWDGTVALYVLKSVSLGRKGGILKLGIFDKLLGKKDKRVDFALKKGVLQDTAHMSIDTTAITLGYIAKSNPEEIILYHAKDKTVLEKFVRIATLLGYKINEITSERISTSLMKGINVFTTPVLLEIVSKGEMEKLEKPFLFTDDYQAAKNATGWPFIKEPLSDVYGVHPSKRGTQQEKKSFSET